MKKSKDKPGDKQKRETQLSKIYGMQQKEF